MKRHRLNLRELARVRALITERRIEGEPVVMLERALGALEELDAKQAADEAADRAAVAAEKKQVERQRLVPVGQGSLGI